MTIIKTKNSDLSYVQKLAEAIKILLDKNISGEGWSMMKSVNKVKCETCGKCYSSKRYLKSHTTKMHTGDKSTKVGPKLCTICNTTFLTVWNLKSHLVLCKREIKMSKKRKPISDTDFTDLKVEPSTKLDDVEKAKCNSCNNTFKSDSEISKHIQSYHSTQIRTCSKCDLKFKEMTMIECLTVQTVHERNDCLIRKDPNLESKSRECNVCDFDSTDKYTMDEHIEGDHGEASKTPPFKKRKKETNMKCNENIMDTDENEDILEKIEKMTIKEKLKMKKRK